MGPNILNKLKLGGGEMPLSQVTIGAAFFAGVLAFFSPCVLPLLPVYLSVLAGSNNNHTKDNRGPLLLNTGAFVIGFSLVFIMLGLSVTAVSRYLIFNRDMLSKVAGIFVILLGLFLMGVFNLPFLMREHRREVNIKSISPISAFVLGSAFSLGWTPCIGPVLSSVLLMASSTQSFISGFWMLLVFSLGLAIPFMTLALLADKALGILKKAGKYMPYIQKVSGGVLVVMGILLFLNRI